MIGKKFVNKIVEQNLLYFYCYLQHLDLVDDNLTFEKWCKDEYLVWLKDFTAKKK